MTDQVYDADNNPAWLTSAVFTDEEIINSVLRENVASVQQLSEESIENTSFETSFASVGELPDEPTFSDAIKSLDCVLRFVKNDAADVSRLSSLRAKLIDDEERILRKRIM